MAKKAKGRNRTAIWSVRTKWRNTYFVLFYMQLVWILVTSVWSYFGTPPAWITIYKEIVDSMTAQIFVHAIFVLFLTEVYRMLADAFEQWLKKSQREKGIEIGMERGIEKERSQWRAWNMRRELAQSEGREFSEPPPNGKYNG